MNENDSQPTLNFFRTTPDNLMQRPPLCSSLQSLESSFILIALGRHPHALVACASAIESAIKAWLTKGPEDKDGLQKLVGQARQRSQRLREFHEPDLENFRTTRNRMVHYGFSPKDDHVAASLLLRVGFRFLNSCYTEFFDFTLETGLLAEFYERLMTAQRVHHRAQHVPDVGLSYCFIAFGHYVRWSLRESLMAHWECESAQWADERGVKFDSCKRQKEKLQGILDPCWAFDCPNCHDIETFIAELDGRQLDTAKVHLLRAACASCGLVIPAGCPFLADEICKGGVDRHRSAILRDYGIVATS